MTQATPHNGPEIHRGSPFAACRNTPEAAMTQRHTITLILCVAISVAGQVVASDLESIEPAVSASAPASAVHAAVSTDREEPRVSGDLYPRTEAKLQQAFPVALAHFRDNPECADLFARFGTDGLDKLVSSIYYPSNAAIEQRVCQGGVAAFTFIGGPQVRLCKRFASLGTERAAAVLIHEALHYAGLSEYPRDPQGMHARDIDRMVKKACGF